MALKTSSGAQQTPVDVVGSSTFGRYKKIGVAQTYNMFESEGWLVNFAGYKRVIDFGGITGRGIFNSVRGNFMLVVVDDTVFRVEANLTRVEVGKLNSATGEVFMDENLSSQICIVDGQQAWIYSYDGVPALTLQVIAAPLELAPNYVTYHNTFFLFGNALRTGNGSTWYAYDFDTTTTIKRVTQLALQTKPDNAIAVRRLPSQADQVMVFGRTVAEIWTQVGGLQNYRRNSTLSIDYGCASVDTIAASDKSILWLGVNETNSPVIMEYKPGQGLRDISTDGIDFIMQEIKEPSKSTAVIYRQDGHLFYHLTFFGEQDNITFVYDLTTEKFFNLSDENLDYHPAREMVFFAQRWYFVSLRNGAMYRSSTDITVIDENIGGTNPDLIHEIQRIRICSPIRQEDNARFRIISFNFTLEQGQDPDCHPDVFDGLITEALNDPSLDDIVLEDLLGGGLIVTQNSSSNLSITYCPRVDCSFSKDGGVTWSNTVSRRLQPVAHRKNQLTWDGLGAANDFSLKLRFWTRSRMVCANGVAVIK